MGKGAEVQFSSVTQSCLTLSNPMDSSMPGFPVHHQLLELTQTHFHRVCDAIQPSHSLSSPSPPAFSLSKFRVFSTKSILRIRWPKYWSFSFSIRPSKEHSALISFRMDWFDLRDFSIAQMVKSLPAIQGTWVQSLGQEDPLEKEMATHSSIYAERISWTGEPGRLQSMGSQRVGRD